MKRRRSLVALYAPITLCLLQVLASAGGAPVTANATCHASGDAIDNEPARMVQASNGRDGATLKQIDKAGSTYYFDRLGRLVRENYAGETLRAWGYTGNDPLPTSAAFKGDWWKMERNADGVVVRNFDSGGILRSQSDVACVGDQVVITSRASDGQSSTRYIYSHGHLVETLRDPPEADNHPDKSTWIYQTLPGGKWSVEARGFAGERSARLAFTRFRADGRVEDAWNPAPSMTLTIGGDQHWKLPSSEAGGHTFSTYKDDKHGNWVTRIDCTSSEQDPGKQFCMTIERSITYW